MDVKYVPGEWEQMEKGIWKKLLGSGFGEGMKQHLEDLCENLKDAKEDIEKYDVDGAIYFPYTSREKDYESHFEDFEVLARFSGKVGEIVEQTIDEPFYKDMDAFVAAIRDTSIANYTTKNRIGAKDIVTTAIGYGQDVTREIPKAEVSLEDLFNGDNIYSERIASEYEAWKVENPDEDVNLDDYKKGTIQGRAFEYTSIKNKQENTEFWVGIGVLAVTVAVSFICAPAAIAIGAAYAAYDLESAISGTDLISGRELGQGERWTRGLLAGVDLVPGLNSLSKFRPAIKAVNVVKDSTALGMKTAFKQVDKAAARVDELLVKAGTAGKARLRNAGKSAVDAANIIRNKLIDDAIELAKGADTVVTGIKQAGVNLRQSPELAGVGAVKETVENTKTSENFVKDVLGKYKIEMRTQPDAGGGSFVKGSGKVYPTRQIDPIAEGHIMDRVKELRGSLTSKYKKAGNFAFAEVEVNGINKKEFYASSKIDEFKGNLEEKVPEISLKPNEPIFEASLAPGKDGKAFMRDSDTEYKILNEIALKLGNDVNATGKIKLFTELDTCESCSKIIAEFAKKYKNIDLEVIHNNGERIRP